MDKRLALFGLAALLSVGTAALLPEAAGAQAAAPADIILTRQAGYDLVGATFGSMKPTEAKVDVKPFAARADAIAKWGQQIALVFPAGSDTGHPTKALATVWSDRAGFEKAAATLVAAAEKLSVVAKTGDADAFAAQWKVTGEACGACHKDFRGK